MNLHSGRPGSVTAQSGIEMTQSHNGLKHCLAATDSVSDGLRSSYLPELEVAGILTNG